MTVPPAKTTVEVPGSSVPAVYVQLCGRPDRAGQGERARRLVDDDQGQVAGGRRRGAGEGLGAGAVDEQGGGAAVERRGLADRALRGERAGPLMRAVGQGQRAGDGQGRARGDGEGRSLPLSSTSLRVWLPVIVWCPRRRRVEVPGSSVPAVYVQLWLVRSVPARVSVPDGLLMTTRGRSPAARRRGPGERLGAGAVDQQGAVPPTKAAVVDTSPWASRTPVPLRVPEVRVAWPVARMCRCW